MSLSIKQNFSADKKLISFVAEDILMQFKSEGYEAESNLLENGMTQINLERGGFVKKIFGFKNYFVIQLIPEESGISSKIKVPFFKAIALPLFISIFMFNLIYTIPIALIQWYGIYKQHKLVKSILTVVATSIQSLDVPEAPQTPQTPQVSFNHKKNMKFPSEMINRNF